MSKKFSISEGMLEGISKNTEKVATLVAKDNFKIEYIDIDKIVRNEKNFYEISNISELVKDISLNGLNHNLVVRPSSEEGLYELISGERRYTALKELVKNGEDKFKKVPCKVSELNDLDSEIVLIQANAQSRELTEIDKLKQIQRLKELYIIKKGKGEKVGTIREVVAKDTGLSMTQVGRYDTINNNLIPDLKDALEKGNLTVTSASEFAKLNEDNQRLILEVIKKEIDISKSEAISLKNKFKEIEKEKEDLLKKINNSTNSNEDIDKIANEKAKEIASKFENDKKNIEKENLKLKNELQEFKKDESKIALNQELKIRIKNVRQEMSKVTGLMANNTIMDELTLKEVNNLKSELRFLNEQIELYCNQI